MTECVVNGTGLTLAVTGSIADPALSADRLPRPKIVLYFSNGEENRRLPLVLQNVSYIQNRCVFDGRYTYKLPYIYWTTRGKRLPGTLTLHLSYGTDYVENAAFALAPDALLPDGLRYEVTAGDSVIYLTALKTPAWRVWAGRCVAPFRFLFYTANGLLAFCLTPWFLLEALLAFVHIGRWDPRVKSHNPLRRVLGHVNARFSRLARYKPTLSKLYKGGMICLYRLFCLLPVQKNRVTFISMRRNDLSGNFQFVYEQMKDRADLKLRFILSYRATAALPPLVLWRFCYACAVSKVVVLDEFTPLIHALNLRPQTKLIQLWHACGAFKTFGFTRLGKPAGSPQPTRMHRNYDYVTVSSTFCKRCHSEGFGIADEKVVPTGIARTDVFFNGDYARRTRQGLFARFPQLQGKKVVLFAPTFRGTVKETAYYPMHMLDLEALCAALGDDYAVVVKHHPFVSERQPIPAAYAHRIVDCSDDTELNDLLFITDVVITDYSSLIFEAALLKIPMLFYVFDLQEYIRERDFYFDLQLESPGKLVYTQQQLTDALLREDYETDRMEAFTRKFFDHLDGRSTERIVALIDRALGE